MTRSETLHRNDKLWGAVAEALVAAYALIGAAGKLSSYRPFTDVDGKDIVMDLAGGFKDIYLQVKCALQINRNYRIGGTVRLHEDHVPSSSKFVYVFCLLDRPKMGEDERWDEFEVTRDELGPRLVSLIGVAATDRRRVKQRVPPGRWLELAA
jgi:hypothetical protein